MAMDQTSVLWMALSVLLTLLMVPGLGLFYGGFCRAKHSVNAFFMCLFPVAPLLLMWFLFGYTFVFGKSLGGVIGGLDYLALNALPSVAQDFGSSLLFVLFQGLFSVLACAIISGAVVERIRHGFWMSFALLWTLLVYYPVAHWVWGEGGWIAALGGKDFAGGLVVHISSGASAFILAKSIGRRLDFFKLKQSYNLGTVFIGSTLLWVGWFGFNGGSALGFNPAAISAIVSTLCASVCALLSWYLLDLVFTPHRPSFKGLNIALICGLVAITPGAGYVDLWGGVVIGLLSGAICNIGARYFHSVIRVDDALDVFISHGLSGFIGALFVGLWLGSDWGIFKANLIGSLAVMAYAMLVTKGIFIVLSKFISARMDQKEEEAGADLSMHGERVLILKNGQEY